MWRVRDIEAASSGFAVIAFLEMCAEAKGQGMLLEKFRGRGSVEKEKGCDIGYALASNSCEGVRRRGRMYRHSLRCDHRFRGIEPQLLLAEPSVFSGSIVPRVTPLN